MGIHKDEKLVCIFAGIVLEEYTIPLKVYQSIIN